MANLHIVSVGGTGHKVLASLIHLAACGAFRSKQFAEIDIITIDADNANGNLARTKKTFENYKKFYQAVNGSGSDLIRINSVVSDLNISLFQGDKKSLGNAFNFTNLHASSEDELIKFLYTNDEIAAEFEEGFYGHTSIGAVIVRDILMEEKKDGGEENPARKAWGDFKKHISNEDQIVVVGSIFGGTGASCIPVVLKELEDKKNNGTGLATVILTPYFQAVRESDIEETGQPDVNKLQPDSNNFNIKAKAALNYYEIEKKLEATHALYVIGEPSANYSYELASRGNESQKNKAHPIELFAATAILDFVLNNTNRRNGNLCVAKRDFIDGEYCYTWQMLQDVDPDLPRLMQTFTRTAIFYNKALYPQLANDHKAAGIWKKYYHDSQRPLEKLMDEKNQLYYKSIREYLELFVEWMFEMHKKNLKEIDPEAQQPALKWIPDERVKLLKVQLKDERFSTEGRSSGRVHNFEKLVYPEEKEGRTSEEILAELSCNKPNGNGFPALFVTLKELLKKEKKSRRQGSVSELKIEPKNYLSDHNKVEFHVSAEHKSLWELCPMTDTLGEIAEGLPDTDRKIYTVNDVSIPSPWSIFITHEMSLTRKQFRGLNEYAYNRWCGLIALLVLRKLNNYEAGHLLKVERLPAWKDENGRFLQIIKDLNPPQSRIFGKQNPDWLAHAAVKLGDETIAFLAHNTLVCPVFSMSSAAKTQLHHFAPTIVGSDGEFLNPAEYFRDQNDSNNKRSKHALQLVLDRLKEEIAGNSIEGVNIEIAKSIMELLKKYVKDLGDVRNIDQATVNSVSLSSELSVNSVYDVFDQLCIKGPKVAAGNLPFLLKNTLHEKKAAIVSLDFSGITNAELKTSYVTPDLVYSQIRNDNIKDLVAKSERQEIELVYDRDLLCDSMVMREKERSGEENVFHSLSSSPGASLSDYEVVWPVSEKLLELYTPDQLNEMLDIKKDNNTVYVTLTLALKGEKMRSHSVVKKYNIKQIADSDRGIDDVETCSVFDSRRLPLWAVWPYAKIENRGESVWKRYTFLCADPFYNKSPVFAIKPLSTGGSEVKVSETFLTAITERTDVTRLYYRRCKELPVMFKISEQTGGNPVYRGVVFLKPPQSTFLGTSTWNVGVDFGTTSTSVYYNVPGSAPNPLRLLTEYRWRNANDDEFEIVGGELESGIKILCNSGDEYFLKNYFIDEKCLAQNGYTTAFEELENTRGGDDVTPFNAGRVFWHNHKVLLNVNAVDRRKNLKRHIKWGDDQVSAARYLNQMITQISYRAIENKVSEIRWFFSYPTAFSSEAREGFKSRLKRLIGDSKEKEVLKEDTGLNHKFTVKNDESLLTESVAAALFFKEKLDNRQSTFLCLDIGGGTSDISIWVSGALKFQTSIKFASTEMFVEWLQKLFDRDSVWYSIVEKYDDADKIKTMLTYDQKRPGPESFPFLLETVLVEYFDDFKDRLNISLTGADIKARQNVIYLIYVAYAGLIFYLANIIIFLLGNNSELESLNPETTNKIVLGLSGKGSKLIDWIPGYWTAIYKEVKNLIREKTGAEITLEHEFQGDKAKTETAYGLICDLDMDGKRNSGSEKIIPKIYMGCSCSVTAKDTGENDFFGKDRLESVYLPLFQEPKNLEVQFDYTGLADFDQFVEFLDRVAQEAHYEVAAVPRGWYEEKKKSLLSETNEYFNERILKKERRFDPPFIVMLRVFLKQYSEYLMEDKDGRE
jgi:hypothetical protein